MFLGRSHVLVFAAFLCNILDVSGHAYVYWPASRVRQKYFYLAHSQNSPKTAAGVSSAAGFKDFVSKHGAPPKGRSGPRTGSEWAWDICGQGPDPGTQKAGDSWKNWAGPPIATYQQGGTITFTVVVDGEHGGTHEWRLCPKKIDGRMGLREAAECLDMSLIGRSCTPGAGCGCNDDKCKSSTKPGKNKDDPMFKETIPASAPQSVRRQADFLSLGAHQFTYTLPKGVSCDECTVQWFWATAYNEFFRNCIDIRIEGNGNPTPAPPGATPAPTGEPSRRRSAGRRRRRSSRRRSTRRRSSRRRSSKRRRSSRRRSSSRSSSHMTAAGTDASPVDRTHAIGTELEYQELGCFPLAEFDGAADHLDCDCDTGSGKRLYDTAPRDYTCMHHKMGPVCRGGLPFYRMVVNKNEADRTCMSFCVAKGADLFGLLGFNNASAPTVECRCGATLTNYKFWKAAGRKDGNPTPLPHSSLLLDRGTELEDCSGHAVRIYSYEGWKQLPGSSGVQDALIDSDTGDEDMDYMASILQGHLMEGGKPA